MKQKSNIDLMTNYFETIIIGSGISGLMTLKHLKERNHHKVLVIEKNGYPFGVWNIKNHPSVLPETYCVSSKLYMTISDFPMGDNVPEFPHHSDILTYYYQYAQKYKLLTHIRYNISVLKALKKGKLWYVHTNKSVFRTHNLVVATGTVNHNLNIPRDPIYSKFKGEIYHADQFKNIRKHLINKKILLVGVSETSCDLALILKNNNQVTMSSRNGVWMQSRTLGANSPADMLYNRYSQQCIRCLGKRLYNNTFFIPFSETFLRMWGNNGHGIPEWETNSNYMSSIWNKNRDILTYISKGQVTPQGNIINIDNKTVTFANKKKNDFDVIIFGTGYKPFGGVDFLDQKYYKYLYKQIFSYEDPNLYFVGFIRPFVTGIPMISELQGRWIAQEIDTRNSTLPSRRRMLKIILGDQQRQYYEFPRYARKMKTVVNPYDYCDMVAKNIRALPNVWKFLFINPKLFNKLEFHSWNHHIYRLNDPDHQKRMIALDNINLNSSNQTSNHIVRISIYSIILSTLFYLLIIIVIVLMLYFLIKKLR